MKYKKYTGIKRLFAALVNSFAGFKFALKHEAAVRQEFFLVVILLPIALFCGKPLVEIILLISGLFAVLVTELLNTAIEYAVDRISKDYHDLSKASKDIASAAVLLSLIYCAGIWTAIFFL